MPSHTTSGNPNGPPSSSDALVPTQGRDSALLCAVRMQPPTPGASLALVLDQHPNGPGDQPAQGASSELVDSWASDLVNVTIPTPLLQHRDELDPPTG